MSRAAPHRGRDPIAATVGVQLLWHHLVVEADDEEVGESLRVVFSFPRQPMATCRAMHYRVSPTANGYAIDEEGDRAAEGETVEDARDIVHTRTHRRAFELASLSGWLRLHGALVDIEGVRVLISGPSGAGKSTLAARLLVDGADVQGDESLLLRDGESVAVPRPLFLEPGVDQLVPELADVLPDLPRIGEGAVLDPAVRLGLPWELRFAPIAHVVVLERGPGPVRCEPASTPDVLPRLAQELFPVTETKPTVLRALAGMLGGARCHRLTVGDPREMAAALRTAIAATAPRG